MSPDRFPSGIARGNAGRYAAAVGLAAGLLLALQWVDPLQGVPFTMALAAITVSSVALGAGPGLVATVLAGTGIWLWFQAPGAPHPPTGAREIIHLLAFLAASTAVQAAIAILNRTRRGLVSAQARAERALEVQRQLSDGAQGAAELLRDERDFVSTIVDTTASLVVVLDARGTIVRFNRAAERASGRRAEEVLGQRYDRFVDPGELDALRGLAARLATASGVITYENGWVARDGTEHACAWSVTTVRDGSGGVRYVVASGLDITERKRADEALRQSEAGFRELAETMPQMVWTTRPDGRNEYVNGRWFEYTGAGATDAEGQGWLRFLHPDDVERARERWQRSVQAGEPFEAEFRFRRGLDGSYRWFLARALPLRDDAGRITRWFGTATDIHDQKQAQADLTDEKSRLELADARKNEFLAVLSHEIRNPLSPIRNAVYILQRAEPGGEQARRALAVIDRQIHQVSRLVDDLLDVTRISRGKIRLQRERLALDEVVRGTADDLRSLFEAAGVALDVDLERPCFVVGDATRLSQVVDNLLINAAKFTPQGGRVVLSLEAGDGVARLRVRDTGAGLSRDQLERLFEPFVQEGRTLERSRGGLGLGLALVKGLVELHGGAVSASSDGPGAGAEFVVSLPREQPGELQPGVGYQPAAASAGLH